VNEMLRLLISTYALPKRKYILLYHAFKVTSESIFFQRIQHTLSFGNGLSLGASKYWCSL